MYQASTTTRFSRQPGRNAGRARRGYTIIELLVVITIIVVLAGVALPNIVAMFSAGAQSAAYNMLAAQITAARACAIQNGTFAALHIQMSITNDPKINPGCYVAVMLYDRTNGNFGLAEGYTPRRMPGTMAIGEIRVDPNTAGGTPGYFVIPGSTMPAAYQNLTNVDLDDFREMTIVFSPTGSIVNSIGSSGIVFKPYTAGDKSTYMFEDPADATANKVGLWDDPSDPTVGWNSTSPESGVSAVVLFDNTVLKNTPEADRPALLEKIGRIAPINVYTGQLFDR